MFPCDEKEEGATLGGRTLFIVHGGIPVKSEVQSTIVESGIEQHQVFAILSLVENAVGGVEVLGDSVAHHGFPVGAVSGGDAHHVGAECIDGILDEVILVAVEVECTTQAMHADVHLVGVHAVGAVALFVVCECECHAHHEHHA